MRVKTAGVKLIGVAVAVVVAGTAAWLLYERGPQSGVEIEDSAPVPAYAPEQDEAPSLVERMLPSEGGPVVDEVSIPAFSQRTFSGSDFTRGRVLADNVSYTRYYITYTSGELTISGIMNVPKSEPPAGGFPLLVLNHGYIDPAVYTNGRGLKREQDYLARQGYVVVHPDYRNHADSDDDSNTDRQFRFGYAEDVINAIKAIEASDLPYVDSERVGMLGHSMGGGVAWRVAVAQPSLVDAFVQFAPVSADERDNFNKWIRRRPEIAAAIVAEHGEPSVHPEFWDNISPLTFFRHVAKPIMIHHGTADDSVPLEWSERAADELEALGKDIVLHVYPREPHEFVDAWPQVMQRTTAFFDQHLK